MTRRAGRASWDTHATDGSVVVPLDQPTLAVSVAMSSGPRRRSYQSMSGVTETPCTTIDAATTVSVTPVIRLASAGSRPWFVA